MTSSISERPARENVGSTVPPRAPWDLVVLDFDGVLCDSAPECYVSSLRAHRGLDALTSLRPDTSQEGPFGEFLRLRPFARSGEDFLIIHEAVERGLQIQDQASFDALVREAGPERMSVHRKNLYEVRERLASAETEYWVELNPIYPHLQDVLPLLALREQAYILSTKRSDLVGRILGAKGVMYPARRILDPEQRPKLAVVRDLMRGTDTHQTLFVDDQIDHFAGASRTAPEVDCRLAAWGYVRPDWLTDTPDYRVLLPAEARTLLTRWAAQASLPG